MGILVILLTLWTKKLQNKEPNIVQIRLNLSFNSNDAELNTKSIRYEFQDISGIIGTFTLIPTKKSVSGFFLKANRKIWEIWAMFERWWLFAVILFFRKRVVSYQIRWYYVHLRCDSLEVKIYKWKRWTKNNTREKYKWTCQH